MSHDEVSDWLPIAPTTENRFGFFVAMLARFGHCVGSSDLNHSHYQVNAPAQSAHICSLPMLAQKQFCVPF
jgi:hypothetical protein